MATIFNSDQNNIIRKEFEKAEVYLKDKRNKDKKYEEIFISLTLKMENAVNYSSDLIISISNEFLEGYESDNISDSIKKIEKMRLLIDSTEKEIEEYEKIAIRTFQEDEENSQNLSELLQEIEEEELRKKSRKSGRPPKKEFTDAKEPKRGLVLFKDDFYIKCKYCGKIFSTNNKNLIDDSPKIFDRCYHCRKTMRISKCRHISFDEYFDKLNTYNIK